MQKEKTIRQLYYGNIQPSTKSIIAGSTFQKAQFCFSDLAERASIAFGYTPMQLGGRTHTPNEWSDKIMRYRSFIEKI